MRWAWGGLVAAALLAGACGQRALTLERMPMGTWVVKSYIAPRDLGSVGRAHLAQRWVGKALRLSPDWIEGPAQGDTCSPGGYRLYLRRLADEELFDPRTPGSFYAPDLGLKQAEAFEVRSFCPHKLYLSWDRTRLFMLQDGYLLALEPSGRIRFDLTLTPEPLRTPTPRVEMMDLGPRPTPLPQE